MNVLSWFSRKKTSPYRVLFDIGSGSVGAALVRTRDDDSIEIQYTVRVPIVFPEVGTAQGLADALGRATTLAGEGVLGALKKVPDHGGNFLVNTIVHQPWCTSSTSRAEKALKEEVVITKQLLKKFVLSYLPNSTPEGHIEFDSHITRVALNGYATKDPYGKRADKVGVVLVRSTMATPVHAALSNAVQSIFPNHDVHMDSFMLASLFARGLFSDDDAYTLVDVGGAYTTVAAVSEGVVRNTVSASFGSNMILDAAHPSEDSAGRSTARAMLAMHFDKTSTPAQQRSVGAALMRVEKEWGEVFGTLCTEMTAQLKLSPRVYIFGDAMYTSWLAEVVQKIDYAPFTTTGRPFERREVRLKGMQPRIYTNTDAQHDFMLRIAAFLVFNDH